MESERGVKEQWKEMKMLEETWGRVIEETGRRGEERQREKGKGWKRRRSGQGRQPERGRDERWQGTGTRC